MTAPFEMAFVVARPGDLGILSARSAPLLIVGEVSKFIKPFLTMLKMGPR